VLLYEENNALYCQLVYFEYVVFLKLSIVITFLHAQAYVIAYMQFFLYFGAQLKTLIEYVIPVYFRPIFIASNMQATYFSTFGLVIQDHQHLSTGVQH